MDYDKYLCAVVAGVVVLGIGCINPVMFQHKDANGKTHGCPNYMWLALFAFLGAAITLYLQYEY